MRTRSFVLLYATLGLLTFTTFETLAFGTHGLQYSLDVFDDGGGIPRLAMTSASLLAHGATWWNPVLTAGNDSLAQFAISPWAPDALTAVVVGPFAAYALTAWLMAVIAGIGMHLFLRDTLRLPLAACVLGATFYLFGFWHYIMGFSAVAIPLLLWLADRAVSPGGRRWAFVLGWVGVGAFVLYDGNSQLALIVGVLQLAWLLATRSDVPLRDRIGTWLAAWVLSLAAFGPALVAQLVFLPGSERSIWDLGYLFEARLGPALANTISFYAGVLVGLPVNRDIGGSPGRYGTFFPGALGIAMLCLGIVSVVRTPSRRTLFVAALLAIIPVLDLAAVLFTPIQQHLGVLSTFQLVRVRHLMPFAVAAIVAVGCASVVDPVAQVWSWGRRTLLPAILLLAAAVSIWQATFAGLRFLRIIRAGHGLTIPGIGWFLGGLSLAAGLAALTLGMVYLWRRPAGARVLVACIAILFVADRVAFAQAERLTGIHLASYADAFAPDAAEDYVVKASGGALERVLSVDSDANRMAGAGLLQADGYQAIYPLSYHDLFGVLIAPHLEIDTSDRERFEKWGARAYAFGPEIDPDVADLLGVRWIYARGPTPSGSGLVARFAADGVTVLENTQVLPRAFVAGAVARETTKDALTTALADASREDLAATAYMLEADVAGSDLGGLPTASSAGTGGTGGAPGPATRTATIASYTPDRVEIDVPDGPAGMLVLTDVYAPGWVAEVDGQPSTIVPADLALRGVVLGAGSHRVVFRYAPGSATVGLGLSLLSMVAAFGWATVVRRRGRRTDTDLRRPLGSATLSP